MGLAVALLTHVMTAHATGPASEQVDACNLELPPEHARRLLDARGIGAVVYPPELPPRFNGCQRNWTQFDGLRERSIPLMDVYFVAGRPVRAVAYAMGAERTIVSDCRYFDGAVENANSIRPELCPLASSLVDASKDRASTSGARIP